MSDMSFLTAPLASLGLVALMYAVYILANLSRRFGFILKMPAYYRGFYLAIGLMAVALVSHMLRATLILDPKAAPSPFDQNWFYLLTYYLPMAISISICLGVAWRYWSWLLKEQGD